MAVLVAVRVEGCAVRDGGGIRVDVAVFVGARVGSSVRVGVAVFVAVGAVHTASVGVLVGRTVLVRREALTVLTAATSGDVPGLQQACALSTKIMIAIAALSWGPTRLKPVFFFIGHSLFEIRVVLIGVLY